MAVHVVHRGKQGDLIYSLAAIKGIAERSSDIVSLHLRPDPIGNFGNQHFLNLIDLVNSQSNYVQIGSTDGTIPGNISVDFSDWLMNWRDLDLHKNIAVSACRFAQVSDDLVKSPWLSFNGGHSTSDGRTVICWSGHYPSSNTSEFWKDALLRHPEAVFVGIQNDHQRFREKFGFNGDFILTKNFHDTAIAMNKSSLVISDQCPQLAIAHGLFKPVIVEVSQECPDCIFIRDHATYPFTEQGIIASNGFVCQ